MSQDRRMRSKEAACAEVAEAIRKSGGKAIPIPCHVGRREDIKALVAETHKQFGPIDILVCNAAARNPPTTACESHSTLALLHGYMAGSLLRSGTDLGTRNRTWPPVSPFAMVERTPPRERTFAAPQSRNC